MKEKLTSVFRREGVQGVLLVLPFALFWLVFLVWPVIYGFFISLHKWDPLSGNEFLGFRNYIKLFSDERFWNAFVNTFQFSLIAIPLIVIIGLLYALMLYSFRMKKATPWIEAMLFFPYLLNVSIISLIWAWLMDVDYGILLYYLEALGLDPPVFLNNEYWAIPAIAVATVWWLAGYRMIIFRAALNDIPPEYFEAAELDGAKGGKKFFHIILPLIRPPLLFAVVLTTISSFRVLGQVQIMTDGGPGRASEVLSLYLYRYAFDYFQMGQAAAVGFIQFLIILVVTLFSFRVIGMQSEL
jgi:ABC-type sugar transport system permease subunit